MRLFLSRYEILSRGIVSVHFYGFHFSRPCSAFSPHKNGTLMDSGLSGYLIWTPHDRREIPWICFEHIGTQVNRYQGGLSEPSLSFLCRPEGGSPIVVEVLQLFKRSKESKHCKRKTSQCSLTWLALVFWRPLSVKWSPPRKIWTPKNPFQRAIRVT